MIISDFVLFAETLDDPGNPTAGFKMYSGRVYSVLGYIDAMVDIKLEKYLEDNDMPRAKETFEALKYNPGQAQLRREIRDNYKL